MWTQQFKLLALRLRFIFLGDRNHLQRHAVKIRPALHVRVVADNQRNFAGQFPAALAIQQIHQAMIVARDENRDFRSVAGKRHAPFHSQPISDGLKMFRELTHVQREARQIPFHAHQEKIALGIQMLVGVQRVAVTAINKIVDRGVQPFLVGATHQENGGVLHRALRRM